MSSIRTGRNAVARRHLDVLTCDLASVNVRQSDIKRTIDGIRRHAGWLTLVRICMTSIILSHRLAYMSALPGARFAHLSVCLSLSVCVYVCLPSVSRGSYGPSPWWLNCCCLLLFDWWSTGSRPTYLAANAMSFVVLVRYHLCRAKQVLCFVFFCCVSLRAETENCWSEIIDVTWCECDGPLEWSIFGEIFETRYNIFAGVIIRKKHTRSNAAVSCSSRLWYFRVCVKSGIKQSEYHRREVQRV